MQNINEALKKYFGYSEFNPMQEAIIQDVLDNKDVFVLMPTGSGKSLCYQLPAVLRNGIVVVVSPLIALMKDQVDGLKANGINTSYINSSLSFREIDDVKIRLLKNKDKILYVAPERFASHEFLDFLKMLDIKLFAIDEAHCISEWGHDFRPDYRKLKMLKTMFPMVPIIALTATAIPDVQKDIVQTLELSDPKIYKASFNRPNLFYDVRIKESSSVAYEQVVDYIKTHKNESGIIYCQSRKTAEMLARQLDKDGFHALPYHAGLSKDMRTENQDRFIKDDVEIMVATIAFGMGINKPNVRYVIHYDMPKNIEGYYQETGRAGRDRLDSDCILFFSYGDRKKIEIMIEKSINQKKRTTAYKKLDQVVKFCESLGCRRLFLLNYFGEEYREQCGKCDRCFNPIEMFDATEIVKKIFICIKETNQRFGINYITSILTGSESKKIKYNHNKLDCYGIGKDYDNKQWRTFIRELVQLGFIDVAGDMYPILKLNHKSIDVLSGNAFVNLSKLSDTKESIIVSEEKSSLDYTLFEILRVLRKQIADSENIPPYIVFHDISIREMATYYPQTLHNLEKIKGVGDAKLTKYGSSFLEKIIDYCKENNIKEKNIVQTIKISRSKESSETYKTTLDLINKGFSLEQVAMQRGFVVSTIVSHIEKLIISGEQINIDMFVSKEKQEIIMKSIQMFGSQSLSIIKQDLGDTYSYDEIRLVGAKFRLLNYSDQKK